MLEDPENGRKLTIETDEVGVVVYTSNQISDEGEIYGVPSRKHLSEFALKHKGLPNAIHHPDFPSWILKKIKGFLP